MTGKAIKYLAGLWGSLSLIAALFPGAAALFGLEIAPKESRISELYPLLGTSLSCFAILMLTSYADSLKILPLARKMSIISIIISMLSLMAFLSVKTLYLDGSVATSIVEPDGSVYDELRGEGLIKIRRKSPESYIEKKETIEERGDPFDLVGFLFFNIFVTSLTVSFASLGLSQFYAKADSSEKGENA